MWIHDPLKVGDVGVRRGVLTTAYWGWRPYVSVAERRRKALKEMEKRKKKGHLVSPVIIEGRAIVNTFWGQAWCENLERYSDYANRLPRGRTYVRNGSVIDLQISAGTIRSLVRLPARLAMRGRRAL